MRAEDTEKDYKPGREEQFFIKAVIFTTEFNEEDYNQDMRSHQPLAVESLIAGKPC